MVVNDDGEFAFERFAVVVRAETAFEHEDGFSQTQLTQEFGFGKVEHGQAIGALTQYGVDIFDAVTVSIGFDHDPHPRLGELGLSAHLCGLWAMAFRWMVASIGRGMMNFDLKV